MNPTLTQDRQSYAQSGTAVVGLQWGDEGKGKIVDLLAAQFDATVRYNGGANAGHSVVVGGQRYALHLIPSGILCPSSRAVIANGVVVDAEVLLKEIDGLKSRGVDVSGLCISDRAHVVMPYHKVEDELRERFLAGLSTGSASIGTTKRGIGPCYADKAHRSTALRVGDLLDPRVLHARLEIICRLKNAMLRGLATESDGDAPALFNAGDLCGAATALGERLRPMVTDTTYLLNDMARAGKRLLFEGANAAMLDVDHGTHPYVTSSSTTALGIPAGTGLPVGSVRSVIGIMKAYSTRVGNGPLLTELKDELGDRIRKRGNEYGTTTGRPRRVGWLDLVAVRYSAMLNGATSLAVMLLDVLADIDELRVCIGYRRNGQVSDRFTPHADVLSESEPVYRTIRGFGDIANARRASDLPSGARAYLDMIEEFVGVPLRIVSVGPDRTQTIAMNEPAVDTSRTGAA